jgi:hypothetical protein
MEGFMRASQSGELFPSSGRRINVSVSLECTRAEMANAGKVATLLRTERRENSFIQRSIARGPAMAKILMLE